MIAIFTRYHGPTNYRGSRYSARTADGRRVTIAADYSLDASENHARVAARLVRKLDLAPATLARFGDTPDRRGYVFAIIARVVPTGGRKPTTKTIGPAYVVKVPLRGEGLLQAADIIEGGGQ